MSAPPFLTISRRTRKTPFSKRVHQSGVSAYTVYNHTLLPTIFESIEADYRHLKKHVQIWDVTCERQVEVSGPDSNQLIQMLTPRNLDGFKPGKCFYAPITDKNGGMLNDPIFLKIDKNKYWLSISDSDVLLWVKGLAYGMGLNVLIDEPEVAPLAIQGPKSAKLAARIFGEQVHQIEFFNYSMLAFHGCKLLVSRSGWSKQDGFEIFVTGTDIAEPLWDALFKSGEDLNVRAGCPNLIERIEAGLLSYGNDMTRENNPYECGLGRFCEPESAVHCIGRNALLKVAAHGPKKQIRNFSITGNALEPCVHPWPLFANGKIIGEITSAAWSPCFNTNVALGMIAIELSKDGNQVEVETPNGFRDAIVKKSSFI
ncbi:MAG: Dimethylsulfonioproprionate demethylase DmdA [Alphaproteobacteria bacterium MarineAlpha3_Bin5]|nr:dimethylsulfoniopropionate demethylase [Magnetovibrio sp.]PPR79368.1 MAG: Dimethylsulfonioproprionate demethylase DmdA [Alphaproteobacteria bacterium MarineAlpha3_Bin5]